MSRKKSTAVADEKPVDRPALELKRTRNYGLQKISRDTHQYGNRADADEACQRCRQVAAGAEPSQGPRETAVEQVAKTAPQLTHAKEAPMKILGAEANEPTAVAVLRTGEKRMANHNPADALEPTVRREGPLGCRR
jgi:hypothetical protein